MRHLGNSIALLVLVAAANAAATPTPPASAPSNSSPPDGLAIVPPKLLTSPDVTYPEGASGEATVVVVITVNADGSVRGARAESGDEPFATSATSAALGWRFEPAMR